MSPSEVVYEDYDIRFASLEWWDMQLGLRLIRSEDLSKGMKKYEETGRNTKKYEEIGRNRKK